MSCIDNSMFIWAFAVSVATATFASLVVDKLIERNLPKKKGKK